MDELTDNIDSISPDAGENKNEELNEGEISQEANKEGEFEEENEEENLPINENYPEASNTSNINENEDDNEIEDDVPDKEEESQGSLNKEGDTQHSLNKDEETQESLNKEEESQEFSNKDDETQESLNKEDETQESLNKDEDTQESLNKDEEPHEESQESLNKNDELEQENKEDDHEGEIEKTTDPTEHLNEETTSQDKNIEDIEEVDASMNENKDDQHEEEEDVLSDDRTQTAEKSSNKPTSDPMDVDPDDDIESNKNHENEGANDDIADVEMKSVESTEKDKSPEKEETEKSKESNENKESDDPFDNLKSSTDSQALKPSAKSQSSKTMEIDDDEDDDDNRDADDSQDAGGRDETDNVDETSTQDVSATPVENESEAQTENVQEEEQGESADVCLIPDNDAELTGAEKEQAILARQNAEKEHAEKEQEAQKETETSEAVENETTEKETTEKNAETQPEDENADDDFVIEPQVVVEVDNASELPLPTKTLITSIIHVDEKCIECGENKSCEFRYKNDETGLYSYVCKETCCQSLINKEPSRFFIRKKKYMVEELSEQLEELCIVCKNKKQCKYTFKQDNDVIYLCTEDCFNILSKEEPEKLKLKTKLIRVKNLGTNLQINEPQISSTVPELKFVSRTAQEAEMAKLDRNASFERRCKCCHNLINVSSLNLQWQALDFCNQQCLSKYQHQIGGKCRTCKKNVSQTSLGKYCVRFGFEICQFCCATCLDKYKKSLKNCTYCQKDISKSGEGFLAPVGDSELFKDFCSQQCMRNYDTTINPSKKSKIEQCAVCNIKKNVAAELFIDGRCANFCSNPCFSAFKFVNNVVPDKCILCSKYFERKAREHFTIYENNSPRVFCEQVCMNLYITQNRKIVFCQWCKVKKYNFDMIDKVAPTGEVVTMCSLNCLVLYDVSLNKFTKQNVKCDNCMADKAAQYHLTMSDSSIRNFCTYQCVMQFQNQFSSAPLTLNNEINLQRQQQINNASPIPTGLPKRIKSNAQSKNQSPIQQNKQPQIPVISSIQSLASATPDTSSRNKKGSGRTTRKKNDTSYASQMRYQPSPPPIPPPPAKPAKVIPPKVPKKTFGTQTTDPPNKIAVVELPPEMKQKSNMSIQCNPSKETLGITCKPESSEAEIQTVNDIRNKKLIPVPVPIYIPQPIQGHPVPTPIPFPFYFPVPVPVFIPLTKNAGNGIMKEISKLQDKLVADPYEAELLMMAEMVATEKEKKEEPDDTDTNYNNDNNDYGDDVLQMALKMATEYDDQSGVDIQNPMASSDMYNQMQQRNNRPKKRPITSNIETKENNIEPNIKKRRPSDNPVPVQANQNIATEKPDANMCLKFTFGVNAWKQWVMTKNADLERSTIRRKLFKSELLQMTADELNYSLCLFVKEVRKPNGTEYAPDTIYYLVLGIQQYLYENGRIDNIFTDPYYERFTDCLDEVAKKFSVLYNDSQYIVTRVEEEHLWECKQLGAHSPHVLLSTLMFFNTKHFNLTNVDEHMQLSFSHIMKHWKRNPQGTKQPGSRNVLLRFYPPNSGQADSKKKKVYEQQENETNPLRCPVRLYEFYLSKCPESVKTRNDVFYLQPERSCVPDSPVWYSTQPLAQESLSKMLHRVKMVKEINVALLTI